MGFDEEFIKLQVAGCFASWRAGSWSRGSENLIIGTWSSALDHARPSGRFNLGSTHGEDGRSHEGMD